MKPPRRFGIYLSSKPDQSVYGEVAFLGRRLVLPIPWIKRPWRWGKGFVFHENTFWIFQGTDVQMYKTP